MATLRPPHNHSEVDPFARYRVAEVISAVMDTCSSCGILICRYGHGIIDGEQQAPAVPGSTLCNECIRLNYAKQNSRRQPTSTTTKTKQHRHRPTAEANLTDALSRVTGRTTAPRPPMSTKPITVSSPGRARTVAATEAEPDCSICLSPVSPRNTVKGGISRSCDHATHTCRRCLAAHIRHQLSSRLPTASGTGITCPECSAPLSHSEVRRHADSTTFARFDELLTRAAVVSEDTFRWCLRPGCGSGQLHDRGEDEPIVVCYECGGRSCYRHSVVWHEGMTCAEYDNGGVAVPARRVRWDTNSTKALPPLPGAPRTGGSSVARVRRNSDGDGRESRAGENRSSSRSNVETNRPTGRRAAFLAAPENTRSGSSSSAVPPRTSSRVATVAEVSRAHEKKKKANSVVGVVQPMSSSRQRDLLTLLSTPPRSPVTPKAPRSTIGVSREIRSERPTVKTPRSTVGVSSRDTSAVRAGATPTPQQGSDYDRWRGNLEDRIVARAAHPVNNGTSSRSEVRAASSAASSSRKTTAVKTATPQRIKVTATGPSSAPKSAMRKTSSRTSERAPVHQHSNEPSIIIQRRQREEELTMNMIDGMSKVCPGRNCGWRINKSSGCDHMKCLKCGHQFCYECLADWKEIIRHDNSRHKKGCRYYSPFR